MLLCPLTSPLPTLCILCLYYPSTKPPPWAGIPAQPWRAIFSQQHWDNSLKDNIPSWSYKGSHDPGWSRMTLRSGLYKLSITCHLVYEPLSQKKKKNQKTVSITMPWFLTNGTVLRLFWDALLGLSTKSLQLCPTLDCRPPGSSVHGILQARILEWVAMPSSRVPSQPRDHAQVSYVSCISRWFLYH